MSANLHTIVLAAGASRRFGSPKQLANFEGQLLLERALAAATELPGSPVTLVLGAYASDITSRLKPARVSIHINPEWQQGISSSIRAGVSMLPDACEGVLIMLADQPLVNAHGLARLAAAFQQQPRHIIASHYGAVTGVPAIFPRWCFDELAALRGDEGARGLIHHHASQLILIDHPEAALDIDSPQDFPPSRAQ